MAIGDAAYAKGMAVVPPNGGLPEALVKNGYQEINRTRDYIAETRDYIAETRDLIMTVWSVDKGGTGATTKSNARTNLGISSGTGVPSGGEDGDIYFKIV